MRKDEPEAEEWDNVISSAAIPVIAAPSLQAGGGDKERVKLDHLIDIKFDKDKYVLTQAEAARGVTFPYQVVVKEDIPGMIPMSQTSAGIGGPNELLPLAKITGNGQFYGIIDMDVG